MGTFLWGETDGFGLSVEFKLAVKFFISNKMVKRASPLRFTIFHSAVQELSCDPVGRVFGGRCGGWIVATRVGCVRARVR